MNHNIIHKDPNFKAAYVYTSAELFVEASHKACRAVVVIPVYDTLYELEEENKNQTITNGEYELLEVVRDAASKGITYLVVSVG